MEKHYSISWLKERWESGEPLKFVYFWGHTNKHNEQVGKFCFSQWFESPFTVDGTVYKTSEHWMMAHKALLFGDTQTFEKIIQCHKPGEAKELGRQVTSYDDLIWNDRKFDIVKAGNIHKFNQNRAIADFLLNTGDRVLVEASPVDTVWGIGLSQDDPHIDNIYAWPGKNLLGFALMETRDFLQEFGHFKQLENAIEPPWKAFPGIESVDMFWRMGKGEDYVMQFVKYYDALPEKEKVIFELTNPESSGWLDFYTGS